MLFVCKKKDLINRIININQYANQAFCNNAIPKFPKLQSMDNNQNEQTLTTPLSK